MKKNELRNKTNLIKEYLYSEKLIINKTFLFNIDFNPDYNYTDYGRDIAQIYYFHGEKDFRIFFLTLFLILTLHLIFFRNMKNLHFFRMIYLR